MLNLATHYEMVAGLKAYFTTNLASYLAAAVAKIGGGLACPPPAAHVLGYRDLGNSHVFPIACYVAAASPPTVTEAMRAVRVTVEVDIGIAIVHAKPDVLEQQLLAYADAVENLVGENESLGGLVDFAARGAMDYGHGALGDKSAATLVVTVILEKQIIT